jgi:hypothetical protein
MDAMDRLSLVLGAHFYVRTGGYAIFQKLLRDLAPAGFAHAARVACLMTMLPQLPLMARRAWRGEPAAVPPEVFRRGAQLPPLSLDDLAVSTGGRDPLTAALHPVCAAAADADPDLYRLALAFRAELADLATACAGLDPRDLGRDARPEALDLAARYATVLAATACLNVWWWERDDPFLGDPAWAVAALHRLARDSRLAVAADPRPFGARRPLLHAALIDRFAGNRTFDLADRPLPQGAS